MRVLRAPKAAARLGISLATLWRWERSGLIPQRITLGPNVCGWIEEELDEFIRSRPRPRQESGPESQKTRDLRPEVQ